MKAPIDSAPFCKKATYAPLEAAVRGHSCKEFQRDQTNKCKHLIFVFFIIIVATFFFSFSCERDIIKAKKGLVREDF